MKRAQKSGALSGTPFHLRAAITLGMWRALAEVSPKGFKIPKNLDTLTTQLVLEAADMPLAPAAAVPTCRVCKCTEDRACVGGCYWMLPGLCSRCAERLEEEKQQRRAAAATTGVQRELAALDQHRAKRSKAGRSKLPTVGMRRTNRGVTQR